MHTYTSYEDIYLLRSQSRQGLKVGINIFICHPFIIIYFENRLTDYIHHSSTAAFSSVFSYLLTFISKKLLSYKPYLSMGGKRCRSIYFFDTLMLMMYEHNMHIQK